MSKQRHPIVRVLAIPRLAEGKPGKVPEWIRVHKFATLEERILDGLDEEFKKVGIRQEFFLTIDKSMSFDAEKVGKCQRDIISGALPLELASVFLLKSAVAWLSCFMKSNCADHFGLVLECLTECKVSRTYSREAQEMFVVLCEIVVKRTKQDVFTEISSAANMYFGKSRDEDGDPIVVRCLSGIVSHLIHQGQERFGMAYLNLLVLFSSEYPWAFTDESRKMMVQHVAPIITSLDPVALDIMEKAVALIDAQGIEMVFLMIFGTLINKIRAREPRCDMVPSGGGKEPVEVPTDTLTNAFYEVKKEPTFVRGFEPVAFNLAQGVLKMSDDMKEIADRINRMAVWEHCREIVVRVIIGVIMQNRSVNRFMEIAQVLLYIIALLSRTCSVVDAIIAFFDTPLFDPRYSLEDIGDDRWLLLRHNMFALIDANLYECCDEVLERFMRYPVIIGEILSGIAVSDTIDETTVGKTKVMSFVKRIALQYQTIDGVCVEHTVEIEKVRQVLGLLIKNALSRESADRFYRSSPLISIFVSTYGFEKNSRGFVIECVKAAVDAGIAIDGVTASLYVALHTSNPTPQEIELWCDFLSVVNYMLNAQPECVKELTSMGDQLCQYVNRATMANEITGSFMTEISKFFVYMSKFDLLKDIVGKVFSDALSQLPELTNDEEFAKLLKNILVHEAGVIVQPALCAVLVNPFKRSPLICDNIRFFVDLCRDSVVNRRACHDGRLDQCVLTLLSEIKTERCDDLVDVSLELIGHIATQCSSALVVYGYIGLFTPVDFEGKAYLSRYHYRFVEALTKIGFNGRDRQVPCLPWRTDSATIAVSGIPVSRFDTTFRVTMGLKAKRISTARILSFNDTSGTTLMVSINQKSQFDIQVINGDHNVSGYLLSAAIPLENVCSLTFLLRVVDSSRSALEVLVDGKLSGGQIIDRPLFKGDGVNAVIGERDRDTAYELYGVSFMEDKTVFSKAELAYKAGKVVLQVHGDVVVRQVGEYDMGTSFASIMVGLCSVDMLLPLFAQFDIAIQENEASHSGTKLARILMAFLCSGKRAQMMCLRRQGFAKVSFLLHSMNSEYLSNEFYEMFITMFESLSVQELRVDLYKQVLMNFGIWNRASDEELVKISSHWTNQLYTDLGPELMDLLSFRWVVFVLSEFFPCEGGQHIGESINTVRLHIKNIAMIAFKRHPNQKDISFAVGQSTRIRGHHEWYDLVKMIRCIIETTNIHDYLTWDDVIELHRILVKEPNIVLEVIKILLFVHRTGWFNEYGMSLELHMSVIPVLIATARSAAFLSDIIDIANEHHECTTICFYLTQLGNEEHQALMMEKLKPASLRNVGYACLSWMVLCIVKARGAFAEYYTSLLLSLGFPVTKLYFIVMLCAGIQELDITDTRRWFLALAIECVDAGARVELVELLIHVMLNRAQRYNRPDMSKLPVVGELSGPNFSMQRMVAAAEEFKASESSLRFGLLFDGKGEWIDVGIAEICINMIVADDLMKYGDLMGLLAYFLRRSGREVDRLLPDLSPEVTQLLSSQRRLTESGVWFEVIQKTLAPIVKSMTDAMTSAITDFHTSFVERKAGITHLFSRGRNDDSYLCVEFNEVNEFIRSVENAKHESQKAWFHLWNHLAFDGPWKCKATVGRYERHWKRDGTLCGCGYPAKTKVNTDYKDHAFESLCRDIGSFRQAETIYSENLARASSSISALLDLSQVKRQKSEERPDKDARPCVEWPAVVAKLNSQQKCLFWLFSDYIQIVLQDTNRTRTFRASGIEKILHRGILHQPHGIEIFPKSGSSVLLVFECNSFDVLKKIADCKRFSSVLIQTVPSAQFVKSLRITEAWVQRKISTFEYLMKLNIYSGRSFVDTCMYPVFPWVLSNYSSGTIDLTSENVYRDLTKPIGAIDQERLRSLKNRHMPHDEFKKSRFLYTSCYSSPLCIYIWLVRVEPFTTMHIDAQGGRFDHAARLFGAIGGETGAFALSSTCTGDYRELIPEFFFDPTFLLNKNRFDLGTVRNRPLDDVDLPPWCKDAMDFVYLNRKALEGKYVTERINDWIDLIWGVKQTGPEADEADNLFDPYFYESVWAMDELKEYESLALQVKATLESCGQIPTKLFDTKHPIRGPPGPRQVSRRGGPLECEISNAMSVFCFKGELVCCCTDSVRTISISTKKDQTIRVKPWKVKIPEWKVAAPLSNDSVMFLLEDSTVIWASSSNATFMSVDLESNDVICMSASEEFLVVGNDDCAVDIYTNSPGVSRPRLQSFPGFHDQIECCDISTDFDLVVAAAKDGALFFISPSRSTVDHVISLENRRPCMVKITSGWGFVIVYERLETLHDVHYIELFDVNGTRLKLVEIGFKISCWSTWKSLDGFDYLLVHCRDRELQACEVYYLNFKLVERVFGPVQSLCYSPVSEMAFIVQKGQVVAVPFTFDDLQ